MLNTVGYQGERRFQATLTDCGVNGLSKLHHFLKCILCARIFFFVETCSMGFHHLLQSCRDSVEPDSKVKCTTANFNFSSLYTAHVHWIKLGGFQALNWALEGISVWCAAHESVHSSEKASIRIA